MSDTWACRFCGNRQHASYLWCCRCKRTKKGCLANLEKVTASVEQYTKINGIYDATRGLAWLCLELIGELEKKQ
jgi:hypothetical protein